MQIHARAATLVECMHALWYNGGTMKSPEFLTAGTAIGRRGFLAGMAAAIAAGGSCDVHAVDVKALQRKLAGFGAYLPNASV